MSDHRQAGDHLIRPAGAPSKGGYYVKIPQSPTVEPTVVGGEPDESVVAEFSLHTIIAEVSFVTTRCPGGSPISFAPVVAGTCELANYLHL